MDKTYDPRTLERRWYQYWEENNYFVPSGEGPAYCIMLPPPNVTGTLHMGHAFQHSLMDALTRYHRMQGDNTLWQTGTDHAGIATQMVVERQLNAEKLTRHGLGREKFVDRVWQWKRQSGNTITQQMRRLGDSVDWRSERFTMDDDLSQAVTEVFVQLFDEGLIYRGKRLVNWDTTLKTALSDLEVVAEEENGHLWHLRYPLADGAKTLDGKDYVVVATTRPETMLGDVAVAVHPEDARYRHLLGKHVKLPLAERLIPIIADEYVDREFGTGCVKITPAHDFNDYAIGQRHRLPLINVLTQDGSIIDRFEIHEWIKNTIGGDVSQAGSADGTKTVRHEEMPAAYRGLDRFAARKKIVADFETRGLLEKVAPHKLTVPRGDRSGSVIEPLLTDQWYVRIQPLATPALQAVEDGRIRFVPENWSKTYFEWMRNIQDWCISRQLWWGHRIPAWYDAKDNIYVGRNETEVREKYRLPETLRLQQDEDVLDTWFSSALWPFSTLGWPQETASLTEFYPGSVLVTAFDIIFFWVARMIMMGLKFMDEVPFHEVYITGLIRDEHGQKMSKSKGNIIDPIDLIDGIALDSLIEKRTFGMMQPQLADKVSAATKKQFPDGIKPHGTDALRFTFTALAGPSRDINFDLGRLEGNRNFCNKLWNAARYVLMNTEKHDFCSADDETELTLADRWIQSRLAVTIEEVRGHLDNYRFDLASRALYEFTWNEYCDWYLELSKPVLQSSTGSVALQRGTRQTLVQVLESLLRLMHPFMPFITEEIWQRVAPLAGKHGDTIMLQAYPEAGSRDATAEHEIQWVMDFILGVRRIRGEMDIPPSRPLPVILQDMNDKDESLLKQHRALLASLARLEDIRPLADGEKPPQSATALLAEMKILVPMAGLIDVQAELLRLNRLLEKAGRDMQQCESKLANQAFVSNAPPAIVDKERARLEEMRATISQLQAQADKIAALE